MKYIFERINRDFTTKLTAALLAILLWFIVLNINDPYKDKSIFVELDVRNENTLPEKNLYLVNKNYRRTVEIIIRGREKAISSVSPADFQAVLDFSKVKSINDKSISIDGPYYTKNDKQVTLIGMNPKVITIELENIIKTDFPVDLELKGTPKLSYKVIGMRTEPEYVTIQERESLVNTIYQVKALVDVSNIDREKKVIKQPCSVYTKKGEEVASLSNQFTVDVFLEVGKEVPVVPVIEGNPAKDHVYTGYSINTEKVIITGHYETLASINELKTGQIQIEGISETKEYTVPIKLPEGVKLFGMENEVTVTVQIEKLKEKEFEIQKEDINIENMDFTSKLRYEILTQQSKLVLKGRQVYLDNVTISSLTPYIDVKGLQEGTHQVKLKVVSHPEIEVLQLPTIEVKVVKVEDKESEKPAEHKPGEGNEGNGEENKEISEKPRDKISQVIQ
ncbi:MAG: hypothetical protein HPY74_11750 [Firmicutes bacterium]|nr:hypothetical protein [Bacillota bacterium]